MPKVREYDRSKLTQAIEDVKTGRESYRSAERKYGIPKSTIEFKIKHPEHKETFGPSPILTVEEENILVDWIKDTAHKGFPRQANDLKGSVQRFLQENPRKNPFANNRPGDGWIKGFVRRHPDISKRTTEGVTSSSACVSEKDIRGWFSLVHEYITECNLEEVLADPSRIYNGDESGFSICPSTGKVFAEKGTRNVYTVEKTSSKENITVMFTFSADGIICCPMIIYPYQRIPEKISKNVNPTWGIGRSDNGWMTSETFYQYIANVFHPHLVENNIKFPVLLFVDGHRSHLSYQLSLLCNELKIEIIALYPNATRILQPCDVAAFRPLKEAWRQSVREFEENHPGQVLNKVTFASVLEKALNSSIKPVTLVNGFRVCGLFPFNPDAVDYSKCLGGDKPVANIQQSNEDTALTMSCKTFSGIIGEEKNRFFQNYKPEDTDDENLKMLYAVWQQFNKKTDEVTKQTQARIEEQTRTEEEHRYATQSPDSLPEQPLTKQANETMTQKQAHIEEQTYTEAHETVEQTQAHREDQTV